MLWNYILARYYPSSLMIYNNLLDGRNIAFNNGHSAKIIFKKSRILFDVLFYKHDFGLKMLLLPGTKH